MILLQNSLCHSRETINKIEMFVQSIIHNYINLHSFLCFYAQPAHGVLKNKNLSVRHFIKKMQDKKLKLK
jgi:hypothetical protein